MTYRVVLATLMAAFVLSACGGKEPAKTDTAAPAPAATQAAPAETPAQAPAAAPAGEAPKPQ